MQQILDHVRALVAHITDEEALSVDRDALCGREVPKDGVVLGELTIDECRVLVALNRAKVRQMRAKFEHGIAKVLNTGNPAEALKKEKEMQETWPVTDCLHSLLWSMIRRRLFDTGVDSYVPGKENSGNLTLCSGFRIVMTQNCQDEDGGMPDGLPSGLVDLLRKLKKMGGDDVDIRGFQL